MVFALCAGEAEQIRIAMIHLVVSELKTDGGRVLIGHAKTPFCRIVKPVCVLVDVREADKAAPLVVPLLRGFNKPPLRGSERIGKVHVSADIVIGTAAD